MLTFAVSIYITIHTNSSPLCWSDKEVSICSKKGSGHWKDLKHCSAKKVHIKLYEMPCALCDMPYAVMVQPLARMKNMFNLWVQPWSLTGHSGMVPHMYTIIVDDIPLEKNPRHGMIYIIQPDSTFVDWCWLYIPLHHMKIPFPTDPNSFWESGLGMI
jgi:hypothetical protein